MLGNVQRVVREEYPDLARQHQWLSGEHCQH